MDLLQKWHDASRCQSLPANPALCYPAPYYCLSYHLFEYRHLPLAIESSIFIGKVAIRKNEVIDKADDL